MTTEEAIRRCAFWTTLGDSAIGSTTDPEVGAHFEVPDKNTIPREQFTDPNGARVYAIQIPRRIKDGPFEVENLAYKMVVQEIERRLACDA